MEKLYEVLVGELLLQCDWRLALAESCTGGLIAHRITNVAGSSAYFIGGVVTYSNEAKMQLLGVSKDTLSYYGAVSRDTAIEMAHGARHVFAADISLSVTGIAGPGGGTPEKPVGLTWIGLSTADIEDAFHYTWNGDRLVNKQLSAEQALIILITTLQKAKNSKG